MQNKNWKFYFPFRLSKIENPVTLSTVTIHPFLSMTRFIAVASVPVISNVISGQMRVPVCLLFINLSTSKHL